MPRSRSAAGGCSASAGGLASAHVLLPACLPLVRYPPVHVISPVVYSAVATVETVKLPPKQINKPTTRRYYASFGGPDPSGQLPVDWLGTFLFKQLISPAERVRAEEAVGCRIRARMRRFDGRNALE